MNPLEVAAAARNLKHIDPTRLFRIDIFNDPEAGKIEMHTPVTVSGHVDPSRETTFQSDVRVNIDGEQLTIAFEIKGAASLEQAIEMWPHAAMSAAKIIAEQVQGRRTEAAIIASGAMSQPS